VSDEYERFSYKNKEISNASLPEVAVLLFMKSIQIKLHVWDSEEE
jgi:hypothetical protein